MHICRTDTGTLNVKQATEARRAETVQFWVFGERQLTCTIFNLSKIIEILHVFLLKVEF